MKVWQVIIRQSKKSTVEDLMFKNGALHCWLHIKMKIDLRPNKPKNDFLPCWLVLNSSNASFFMSS